jgi:hypothetical protein
MLYRGNSYGRERDTCYKLFASLHAATAGIFFPFFQLYLTAQWASLIAKNVAPWSWNPP